MSALARSSYEQLADNGICVHRIDYGPHDIWRSKENPFEWLTISDAVWSMMGSNRGTPNRFRHHEVVNWFEEAGFNVDVIQTDKFDAGDLDKFHGSFTPRLRDMPRESLAVRSALIKCEKAK